MLKSGTCQASPTKRNETKQAFHEARGLPQQQAKQGFQGQTGLNGGVAELLLPTAFAARWWCRLCCTNGVRDSLFKSKMVADQHEQLVPYEVQDQELAFVQHSAEAARFAIDLV